MEDNNGSKFLREAFAKFAAKYNAEDIGARVIRSVATGGKAAVDQAMQEFPKTFVNQLAKDVYSLLTSQELADGISATVRSFDEEKVKGLVDNLVDSMKNRETALDLAKKIKSALNKHSADDIANQLEGLLSLGNVPPQVQFMVQVLMSQFKPVMENMKYQSEDEIADQIIALADQIPSDQIAEQVAALTREVTPEKVSQQTAALAGKLPSAQAVSDIVHGVGQAVSENLGQVASISTPAEVPAILRDLAENASQIVSETLNKDNEAKKKLNKDGGKFEF